MTKWPTLIRIALVVVVMSLLVQVSHGGEESWASADQDAERQTVPTRTPTAEPVTPTVPVPTSTTEPTATPTVTPLPPLVTAKIDADVYSGPGTDYDIIGLLQAGKSAEVLGRNTNSTWWRIQLEKDPGWVSDAVVTASDRAYQMPVVQVSVPQTSESTPMTLPQAGGKPWLLWGGLFLLTSGLLLILATRQIEWQER